MKFDRFIVINFRYTVIAEITTTTVQKHYLLSDMHQNFISNYFWKGLIEYNV